MTYLVISIHHHQIQLHQKTVKTPTLEFEWLMTIQDLILAHPVPAIVIVKFVKLKKLKGLVNHCRNLPRWPNQKD